MDEMKRRFTAAVAARLAAAPPSTAKDEVVEELSDNLYRRYLDMTGAGMDGETAFRRAMDDLGDVDELLGYLREAEGPSGPQSELDAILAGVSEACNAAIDQAKGALKLAKEALQRRTTVEKDNSRVRFHFNTHPDAPQAPSDGPRPDGWEFDAELDTGEGRFFAGAGPRERRDAVYGFGYDKARGGFFAQWGQPQGRQARDPQAPGGEDGGPCPVGALKDLRGIQVHTAAGDVAIQVSEAPDAGVIIDGDVDDLDVICSADGVLTIREGRTASSSFFSLRGLRSADVKLFLPRRRWETVEVTTASGDVAIGRDGLDAERLAVKTASGDLECRLLACDRLEFRSASGDLDLEGACGRLYAETMSGDISLDGQVEDAVLKSASGDISLEGQIRRARGTSLSGDVSVDSAVLPEAMDLSSKSGDCQARLPDAGPFTLRCTTVSGDTDFAFPFRFEGDAAIYGDGTGPAYSMATISGDVSVERR